MPSSESRPLSVVLWLGLFALCGCPSPAPAPVDLAAMDLRGAVDLALPADLTVPPDLAPFACFTPQSAEWRVIGDVYCRQRGALCIGIDYYGLSNDCSDAVNTACWSSGEAACCATTLADHAGTPVPGSARWRCVPQGTPICGNGKLEGTEVCDDGLRNGVACRPGLGGSCSYCSSTCTRVALTPAAGECITPTNTDWTVTGDVWCAGRGKSCVGTAYTSLNSTCAGALDSQCWGSKPRECCSYPMSDHAGFSPGSARWQCQ